MLVEVFRVVIVDVIAILVVDKLVDPNVEFLYKVLVEFEIFKLDVLFKVLVDVVELGEVKLLKFVQFHILIAPSKPALAIKSL